MQISNMFAPGRILISLAILAILSLGLSGCDDDGAAEQVGKSIDETIETTRDAIDEGLDDVQDAIEDTEE